MPNKGASFTSDANSPVVELSERRRAMEQAKFEQQLRTHGAYFEDPAPYGVEPCQVVPRISLCPTLKSSAPDTIVRMSVASPALSSVRLTTFASDQQPADRQG